MPHLLILLAMFLVISCDDARDLTLPEGQLPDSPIPVVWHPENADYLELRWTKVPRAEGYHVYSSNVSDGSYQRVASVHDTIWQQPLAEAYPDSLYAVYYYVTSLVDSQESLPSGKIGCYFVSVDLLNDSLVVATILFSLYLTDWENDEFGVPIPRTTSLLPQDVIGNGLQVGDEWSNKIFEDSDTSRMAYRDASGDWHGILAEEGFSFTTAYKLRVTTNISLLRTYLTGRVKNGDVGPVWIEGSSEFGSTSTGYAWRDARHLAVSELGLLESGFQGSTSPTSSDQLVASKGGATARFNPVTGEWEGSLVRLKPGDVYYIQLRHPGGFEYTYVAAE